MLVPSLMLYFLVYMFLYITFYPGIAMFLTFLSGPMGIFSAWYIIFQQSAVVAQYLTKILLFPTPQRLLFDSILSREGHDDLVLNGKLRRIVRVPVSFTLSQLLWSLPKLMVVPWWFVRIATIIGLNQIPFAGPLIVMFINAPRKGIAAHSRYFDLKGLDRRQITGVYKSHTGEYMGFGIISGFLETIPILGSFFLFTNTVGAALWALSIENLEDEPNKPIATEKAIPRIQTPIMSSPHIALNAE